MKPPAVRESEYGIEIDQKKGQWPFFKAQVDEDGTLILLIDCNEGGQVINEGAGVAVLRISPKKARRLQEFLERVY